jgi:hypothetical protein
LREIALHVLDLVENALRAGAGVIQVTVEEQPSEDTLRVEVEDDGPGLSVSAEKAVDPFFTEGKRAGLGLPLFKLRVEQAGGTFRLERSAALGGCAVRAVMPLSHVDRPPLGDLAATMASVVCTSPGVELRSRLRVGGREWTASSGELARALPAGTRGDLGVARLMKERIAEGLSALHMSE